jgi:uncharacterized protein
MPEIITYSLQANEKNSDEYFKTIAEFCDEVIGYANVEMKEILISFNSWQETNSIPQKLSFEENLFALLNLGILWKLYGSRAMDSGESSRKILSELVNIRKANTILKPIADFLRGVLNGISSFKNIRNDGDQPDATIQNLDTMFDWLEASGEFDEVVNKLRVWREFLSRKSTSEIETILRKVKTLANWFAEFSMKRLGKFTENVSQFLEVEHPHYRWREDSLFTGKSRIEYHLNMLGTEILNRMLNDDFKKRSHKIVILPPCMKAKPDDECLARQTSLGEQCMHCTPSCRINQITKLGEKKGFLVTIIPDDLKIYSAESSNSENLSSLGVVGVSCPLTNAEGGLEMIRMGVPAQGLPLDYCGCSYHWHKDRIPTDINIRQLLQILK